MGTFVDVVGVLGFLLALAALGIEFRAASADKRTEVIRALIDARNMATTLKRQTASHLMLAEQFVAAHARGASIRDKSAAHLKKAEQIERILSDYFDEIGKDKPNVAHPSFALEYIRGTLIAITDDLSRHAVMSQELATEIQELLQATRTES